MADITRFLFLRHLRGDNASFVLQHRGGKLVRAGRGLQFWFLPLTASIAELPMDDRELPVLFHGRTRDFQDVTVQGVITWRVTDPGVLADRVDFGIDTAKGGWLEQPLEKVALLLTQLAQQLAWDWVSRQDLPGALVDGARAIRACVLEGLGDDPSLAAMGLGIASVRISDVSPTAELEKALQQPTRESIQQEADKATFERRALAVERERAIAENELQNQIELARREEDLIAQRGDNDRRRVSLEAEAARVEVEARVKRERLQAEASAAGIREVEGAKVEAERERIGIYRALPQGVMLGLAARELAGHLPPIEHLSIGPDMLAGAITRLAEAGAQHLQEG
jgi:regulator of protease activity HflC (stomatin/prohibitin superfamily)